MFPCVLLHFKKFSGKYFLVFGKEEGKQKSRKTQATTQKKIINDDKSSLMTTPSIAISPSSRDRDLVKCRSRSRIFLFRLHTRSYNRRFARSRRRSRSREEGEIVIASLIAIDSAVVELDLSSLMIFFWVVACVFLDLCFPSSFPNTIKYFPENFLKCNQTHGNIFLFRKLAFLENMYFSENVLQQPNIALVSRGFGVKT